MSFNKINNFNINKMEPLNQPQGWDIYKLPKTIKTASIEKSNDLDLGGFDLKAELDKHPENLYVKIFAIKEDEPNDNSDAFDKKELKKSAETFIGVPIFTNHQNDDVENSRGECVHAWYDDKSEGIFIIARVDKIAYPKLARGIEEGYVKGTSMGCSVESSCCSICHNSARTADEYCSHIKEGKGRKKSGSFQCKYHESKNTEHEECPVCGCKKGETKHHKLADQKVFEWNYGLKFIENSFVVNPACHTCGVTDLLHMPEVNKKVAELKESTKKLKEAYDNKVQKAASGTCSVKTGKEVKSAGLTELNMLKESINNIENVVKSMMSQKDHVDMDYVSDLVKAMAEMQDTIDELTEMGYAKLPSPPVLNEATADNALSQAETSPQPVVPEPIEQPKNDSVSQQEEVISGLGSITSPKTSNKKKEFSKTSANIREKIAALTSRSINLARGNGDKNMIEVWANKEDTNSHHVIVDDEFITEAQGENIISVTGIESLNDGWKEYIKSEPKKAAKQILDQLTTKESQSKMAEKQTKQAQVGSNPEVSSDKREVITEKQLKDNQSPTYHPRWGDTYETITQDQIEDGGGKMVNDTTTQSPATRLGTYETTTEDQLDVVSDGHIMRWKEAPEVITEKQWDEWSRKVSADLSDDWTETITEDQLGNLLSTHTFVGSYETITEDQLKDQQSGIKRWANASYTKKLTKMAVAAASDAIAYFNQSPQELKSVLASLSDDSAKMDKMAKLTLINSLPFKNEERKNTYAKSQYFTKTANKESNISRNDALMIAVAENAQAGVKVTDVYETLSRMFSNKVAMAAVDSQVKQKLASQDDETVSVDKFAALDSAFESIDGITLKATLEDLGEVNLNDKSALAEAINKLASKEVGEGYKVSHVKIDKSAQVLEALLEELEGLMGGEESMEGIAVEFVGEPMVDEDEDDDDDDDNDADFFELAPDIDETEFEEDIVDDVSEEVEDIEPAMNGEDGEDGEDKDMVPGSYGGSKPMQGGMASMASKKRDKLVKEAQMMGGEMGGQGGASQMPGAGASLPGAPDAAMDANPIESFGDEGADDLDTELDDSQPKPPGSICPVCGSDDVDIVEGKGKCNNCTSEFTYKVQLDVTKWSGLTDSGDEAGGELDEEGFEMPDGGASMPEVPVAAMTKIKPEALRKLSEQKIELGRISPLTGTTNTIKIAKNQYMCLDTGVGYKIDFRINKQASKKSELMAYAQWEWTPKIASNICPSCSRQRKAILNGLKEAGITEDAFDAMSIVKQGKLLSKLASDGKIKQYKEASKNGSILEDYKKAYSISADNFPMESCREKLARRYGKNALALSGPCEGKPIHECVCNSLKKAEIYSTGLAIKVAEEWEDVDGTENCVEQFIRQDMSIRQAASACSMLKSLVAQNESMLADELTDASPFDGTDGPDDGGFVDDTETFEDVDPFDSDVSEDTVTLEIDADLAEKLDAQLDVALGDTTSDLAEEEHHSESTIEDIQEDGVADVEENAEEIEVGGPEELGMEAMKPMEHGDHEKGESCGHSMVSDENSQEKEGISDDSQNNEESEKETMASTDQDLINMQQRVGGVGKTNTLDFDKLAKQLGLSKSAGEKEVTKERAQDSSDIGSISEGTPLEGKNNSSMGHEDETVKDAKHPSVPEGEALIGHESDSLDQSKPLPKIPSDKGTMGHEDETGLSGGDTRMTGGDQGAGESEKEAMSMRGIAKNSKERVNSLAERIATKLDSKKPVSEDEDTKPHSTGKGIGHEDNFSAETPENTEGGKTEALMGHESETLGSTPKSPEDHPDFPEDNATMGHEDENDINPEKQTKNKGTVIANKSGDESKGALSNKEAFRVAGRMLSAGIIKAEQLEDKVADLSQYTPELIRNYEKATFAKVVSNKKGLDTASEGLERPLVISQKQPRSQEGELVSKLQSMFTLDKRSIDAQNAPDYATSKLYNRS